MDREKRPNTPSLACHTGGHPPQQRLEHRVIIRGRRIRCQLRHSLRQCHPAYAHVNWPHRQKHRRKRQSGIPQQGQRRQSGGQRRCRKR
eukprot:14188113-Alexandrium_andersonii.AAC.1